METEGNKPVSPHPDLHLVWDPEVRMYFSPEFNMYAWVQGVPASAEEVREWEASRAKSQNAS